MFRWNRREMMSALSVLPILGIGKAKGLVVEGTEVGEATSKQQGSLRQARYALNRALANEPKEHARIWGIVDAINKSLGFYTTHTYFLLRDGDLFWEAVQGIRPDRNLSSAFLPCETMFRIETTMCKLVEYQQGESPDYFAVSQYPLCLEGNPQSGKRVIRFKPHEIVHARLLGKFYPYGLSYFDLRHLPDSKIISLFQPVLLGSLWELGRQTDVPFDLMAHPKPRI